LKTNRFHITRNLSVLVIVVGIFACNSKGYQNLTAKYNGYYYANLRVEEVEQALDDAHPYNYNEILKIYPDIDSAVIEGNKAKLDDAFTKASQLVDWHSASDYLDNGYLIVGKIRHLRGEFQLAIETLQYVNQTSPDNEEKHAALIVLMRTYMDMDDMDRALQVAGFLEADVLSEENEADFRLTMAYYHQRQNNLQGIAQNLNEVSNTIKDKDERSRSKFILGQIYQKLGFNEEAYDFYKASLAGNPPYELSFYAKLNMQQVSVIGNASSIEKINKYYRSLLKDGKNTEYKGHIYYEMGEFELKQNHHTPALTNYLLSVAVDNPQPNQQALSFLRIGQLYFDHFKDFELAKAYYDSTMTVLPKAAEDYEFIQKRQGVLTEFVTQLRIIQRNDSLLSLSEMNPVSLNAYIENVLIEKEKKAKDAAKQKKIEESQLNAGLDRLDNSASTIQTENTGSWYFYNAAAMSQGELDFQRVWGNRPLEDNWRRSSKQNVSNSNQIQLESDTTLLTGNELNAEESIIDRTAAKEELLKNVPSNQFEKNKLHVEIQEAYYALGNVYRFGLEELDKAAGSYQILVDNYPLAELRPEALFALYSLFIESDPSRSNDYKSQIISEYPETLMAKLLVNPNYLIEQEQRNQELQRIYANAYYQFEAGNYRQAEATLTNAFESIEDVDFLPNAELLLAIMKAKTENIFSYEQALNDFTEEYPDGELHDYAQTLIAGINPVKETIIRNKDFEFSEEFEQSHLISILFLTEEIDVDDLEREVEYYNETTYPDKKLTAGQLEFDSKLGQFVLFINVFETKEEALEYDKGLKIALDNFDASKGKEFDNFVISVDNFQMLYQSKEVEAYRTFYKRFYR
jgi:outer membrane protein assembly factor BamD (BamD/ComL family)